MKKKNINSINVLDVCHDLVNHIKYIFGNTVYYIGTTTDNLSILEIADIDILVVFKKYYEYHSNYIRKIINKIYNKYHLRLDVRIQRKSDLKKNPIINQYLLKKFLTDLYNTNPFKKIKISKPKLKNECLKRVSEQENSIKKELSKVACDINHLKNIAQCTFDAVRAFLLFHEIPCADKKESANLLIKNFNNFEEINNIYKGYIIPNNIIDIDQYIFDCLSINKHLNFKCKEIPIEQRILLINPPSTVIPHPQADNLSNDLNMPLGLIHLASFLNKEKYPTEILDSYAENLGILSTIDKIFTASSLPRLIGFTTMTPNMPIVHRLAKFIKRINDKIIIVCGGPHATLSPEDTLSKDIDYLIKGEGEIPLRNLIRKIFNSKKKEVPGVFKLEDQKIIGKDNDRLFNLATKIELKFNYLPLTKYYSHKKRLYLCTSRGCCYNCIYCSVPKMWNKVREVPFNVLFFQIEKMISDYKPEEIQIVDDNFSHRQARRIDEFCDELERRDISIKWKCQIRADSISQSIINKMAKQNCFEIDVGIESGNRQIQQYIRKNLDLEKTKDIIKYISDANILCKSFFMLGFPNETYSQITDTINYSIELKNIGLKDVAFFPVTPFPGTDLASSRNVSSRFEATIKTTKIYDTSYAAQRLRKYLARPYVSLNKNFNPDRLYILLKFAYTCFEKEQRINNFEKEYNDFLQIEEGSLYAI